MLIHTTRSWIETTGVFIAKAQECCARGHVQKWARGTIGTTSDGIPF